MDLIEGQKGIDINYWYYLRKFNLINNFMKSHKYLSSVCDVGAGQALFSIELSKRYPKSTFVATDINYDGNWLQKDDTPNLKFQLDYVPSRIVLLNDVLEHVDNPILFLSEIVDNSNSGTVFLITVPAFEHLWSGHDEALKHYRRYRVKSLLQEIEAAGLKKIEVKYLYWSIYPLVLVYRKFLSRKSESQMRTRPKLDKLLLSLMKIEERFSQVKLPGISLWCVAIKP